MISQELIDYMTAVLERELRAHPAEPSLRPALIEALKLIDPVPDDATVIYGGDDDGDRFTRVAEGGNVWRYGCGCCFDTYAVLNERYGPLTWECK